MNLSFDREAVPVPPKRGETGNNSLHRCLEMTGTALEPPEQASEIRLNALFQTSGTYEGKMTICERQKTESCSLRHGIGWFTLLNIFFKPRNRSVDCPLSAKQRWQLACFYKFKLEEFV
jgi:hypothetical protein